MFRRIYPAILVVVAVSGCSVTPEGTGPHDPYEIRNRKVHAFNKRLDEKLVRPVSRGFANNTPSDLQDAISNFSDNFALPGVVVNKVLQGELDGALNNTVRFAFNTVFGFGGLFDPATDFGVHEDKTDFGETLYVWGVPEGAYQELPVIGPSTERATAGMVVDLFTNPLGYILPNPEKHAPKLATVGSKMSDRGRYSDVVDSILYDSADSYAQARLIYLQNRRFELGDSTEAEEIDPFALDTEGF